MVAARPGVDGGCSPSSLSFLICTQVIITYLARQKKERKENLVLKTGFASFFTISIHCNSAAILMLSFSLETHIYI